MSATHTNAKRDRRNGVPTTLALAKANHAVHNRTRPSNHRAARGRPGQANGPTRRATPPPSTHTPQASHQAGLGPGLIQPPASARTQAAASTTPITMDRAGDAE